MTIKQLIEQDLKTALLAGEKQKATTLRGLKSAILNAEIAKGSRESGLSDDEVTQILKKEVKARQESAELYQKGGDQTRAQQEQDEKVIIENYLPQQLSDDELNVLVEQTIKELGVSGPQALGQVIGAVKQKAGSKADGSRIAQLVKESLAA